MRLFAVFGLVAALGLLACDTGGAAPGDAGADADSAVSTDGGDGGVATACVPEAISACTCGDGSAGTETCKPDGSGERACDCTRYGRELYVATSGDDGAPGTAAQPKATLDGAFAVVRGLEAGGLPPGGVVIWMAPGIYRVTKTVTVGSDASGASGAPVVVRAQAGAPVRLVGGERLDPSGFSAVTSSDPNYARIDPAAVANVRVFDLGAAGITDLGQLQQRGFCASSGVHSPLELFVDGVPMTLGRWPDADENEVVTPSDTGSSLDVYGTLSPDVTGHYVANGTSDGVSVFERAGLVGGKQYRLFRYSWTYQSQPYTAWFLTTSASGAYPDDTDPWWSLYRADLSGTMDPSNGASGQALFRDPQAIDTGFAMTAGAPSDSSFNYWKDRPSRWTNAPDAWAHGFWKYGWDDCRLPISAINTGSKTITLGSSPDVFGIDTGKPWYAFNLLEEVTEPGEWYVDRATKRLYLYPPHDLSQADIEVSLLDGPLLSLEQAEYVEVHGVVFEASRGTLVTIDGGTHDRLVGVTLRNSGSDGADISGVDNGVTDALVTGVGSTGVDLSGGDRPSLTPANNFVETSDLHDYARLDWTYRPAVNMDGVAERATQNLIYDAPHNAILYYGNEHHIELNEIHDVTRFCSDCGAVYGGRDWGGRGIVIQNNYIHDLHSSLPDPEVVGVYLDDCLSGNHVRGNLLVDVDGYGILHGGGRDDEMTGNVLVRDETALTADARCATWGKPSQTPGDSSNLLEKLEKMNYQQPPWSTTYPLCAAIPDSYAAIFATGATWLYPEGSVFSSNVGYGDATWMTDDGLAFSHYTQENDVVLSASPFVDEKGGNLSLTSEALAVPGMQPIPVDKIGLH